MGSPSSTYRQESIGNVMTRDVPSCSTNATVGEVLKLVASNHWESIHRIFVLDDKKRLKGIVRATRLIGSPPSNPITGIMEPAGDTLHPTADQEDAVYFAIKDDADTIPVVDKEDVFLGAVTAKSIIDVLHAEHFEDALISVGVRHRGNDITKLANAHIFSVLKARAPWLLGGALAGLGLGLISSLFEQTLEKSIALAYFIPVVAYIANSVGTQSQAITIRAIALLKISPVTYLLKEIITGFLLGTLLGLFGGVGAWLISQSPTLGLVVGLSLVAASTIATGMAAGIPMLFKAFKKDPALGSGPLATVLQDVISIFVYFLFAVWLIGV